jgi:hypothetical protein
MAAIQNWLPLAGLNLSGGSGGVFEGDNILELYKSRLMIEKALLSESVFNGKKQLLIDRYVEFNDLKKKWKGKDQINDITFQGNPEKFNRKQDSIITDLTLLFNKQSLNVYKLDKKLNIIKVEFESHDEYFAKEFNDKLVENVNDFYIQTRTKKAYQTVNILQHQADSVKAILNHSIAGVAAATDASPNANPLLQSLRVSSQKKQVDVQVTSAVYGEIIKNLEISKINLRQETPLLQMIDQPVYPLTIERLGKIKGAVLGTFIGAILTVCFIAARKIYHTFLK